MFGVKNIGKKFENHEVTLVFQWWRYWQLTTKLVTYIPCS